MTEVLRRIEPADQLAAHRRRPVDDDQRHVAHVGRRRVAEHGQLNERRHDRRCRRAADPAELEELLSNQTTRRCIWLCLCPLALQPQRGEPEYRHREDDQRRQILQNIRHSHALEHDAAQATRK